MKTLVVTGLFSPLGQAVAHWAAATGVRVLGVDTKPMTRPLPGIEFVRADVRNALFAELLKAEQVDTLFHGAFRWRARRTEADFESNVIGAMKLMGAAALAGVQKIVFPSSTFVYGAHPEAPAFMTEAQTFMGRARMGYVRDLRDIEVFLSGFRHQHPELTVTVLRFANILGRGYPSPLARYLRMPLIPTLLGYDPLLQVLHFDDALTLLQRALLETHPGVYNAAAAPPLPLMKIIRMIDGHSIPIFHPLAYKSLSLSGMFIKQSQDIMPIHWDYLRYSWTVATDRLQQEWDFAPVHDAESVIRQFHAERQDRPAPVAPASAPSA